MSFIRTTFLIAALTALFMGIGFMLGGRAGMLIALLIALGMNFFAYWNSDKMVLRMHNAHEVNASSAPQLYRMVHDLSARADLPMPKVYVIETEQPNAFATGRNPENAAVAASRGLLNALSYDEIEAVMAHELAHIKNRDILIMSITATLAGAIAMIANIGLFFGGGRNNPLGIIGVLLMAILAPLAAMLVQMAISRTREYEADKTGAQICGKPEALASALAKIANSAQRVDNNAAERNPATAHMFIINPLNGQRMDNLFSTHPNTQNRIDALMQMIPQSSGPSRNQRDSSVGPWDKMSQNTQNKGPWG